MSSGTTWCPGNIVSVRGPQFTSRVWKAFMERLGVSVSPTSGLHLESNGQVERVNQDVGKFLRSYCQDRPGEWARHIPWAEMAQNWGTVTNITEGGSPSRSGGGRRRRSTSCSFPFSFGFVLLFSPVPWWGFWVGII